VAGMKCNSADTICDVAVLRYTKNGSLDTSFHGTGYRTDDYGGGDNGSQGAVALQPDGKIVVGGYMYNPTDKNYDFAIYRYTGAGDLDTSFSGTGKKAIPFGNGRNDFITGIAIQPVDAKIIVAGKTCTGNLVISCNFALARLRPDGSLDTSFNGTGKKTTDLGGNDIANDLALQPNGKIVLAGSTETATSNTRFALARYNTNGTLDTTFAGTGKMVFDFSGSDEINGAKAVRIQPSDGKIVVCGNSNGKFALARLTTSGALDTTFDGNGKVSIDFSGTDACNGLAIQPGDGKYMLVGQSTYSAMRHSALARVLP